MSSQIDDRHPGSDAAAHTVSEPGEYVVVARRYRPKTFTELVGQDQVARALGNAILTHRVGHAYLFTGARGVGKTSTARILAKCLNCEQGPTVTPCGECDACLRIGSGDDVDVLEIDGASNRGIDEIRQLRSNVNVRPSRSRFKIYIIDEVHMLTTGAFNALLKTLEEPPEHVKFIFCTTDADKIPITVLSRCQRFDFAPVATDAIMQRLRRIVQEEGVAADDDALRLLARRAAGSMRDSQSLLEQVLSFSGQRITEDDVHVLLGTAHTGRLHSIVRDLIARDAAAALRELDAAVREGVDLGQLMEQLVGYLRDVAAALVGCQPDLMLYVSSTEFDEVRQAGQQWGLETVLAALQILDQALTRMRQATQVRTLAEIALVRICKLDDLESLAGLIAQLRGGPGPALGPPVAAVRRELPPAPKTRPSADANEAGSAEPAPVPRVHTSNVERRDPATPPDADSQPVSPPAPPRGAQPEALPEAPTEIASPDTDTRTAPAMSLEQAWQAALTDVSGLKAELAGDYASLAAPSPKRLVIALKAAYNKEYCDRPEVKRELEQTLSKRLGRAIQIEFIVAAEPDRPCPDKRTAAVSRQQRLRDLQQDPLMREAVRLFDVEVIRVEDPHGE